MIQQQLGLDSSCSKDCYIYGILQSGSKGIIDNGGGVTMNQQDRKELKMITDTVCSVVNVDKIYLIGSFAYGIPREDSDFDLYVLLADEEERPLKAMQKINMALARMDIRSVDILADTASGFYEKSKGPTLERMIMNKGMQIYERNEQIYQSMT